MFLVLAPTVFEGHVDSVCGQDTEWVLPWADDLTWEDDDMPSRSADFIYDWTPLCILWANMIDRLWRKE